MSDLILISLFFRRHEHKALVINSLMERLDVLLQENQPQMNSLSRARRIDSASRGNAEIEILKAYQRKLNEKSTSDYMQKLKEKFGSSRCGRRCRAKLNG